MSDFNFVSQTNINFVIHQMSFFYSCILSFVILLLSFQNTLVLLDYYLNQERYELLCENQNRPYTQCHGKCLVKKESQKQEKLFQLLKINFNFLPSSQVQIDTQYSHFFYFIVFFVFKKLNVCNGYLTSLLKPPRV